MLITFQFSDKKTPVDQMGGGGGGALRSRLDPQMEWSLHDLIITKAYTRVKSYDLPNASPIDSGYLHLGEGWL